MGRRSRRSCTHLFLAGRNRPPSAVRKSEPCRSCGAGGPNEVLVVSFELDDFVFYSKLLPLEVGHRFGIRRRAVHFSVEFRFEMGVPGAERFETIQ
jgi:hypothetical protein